MNIESLNTLQGDVVFDTDKNDRTIYSYHMTDVVLTGDNIRYPNVLFHHKNKIINPIEEVVMSLKDVEKVDTFNFTPKTKYDVCDTPVFFFIYNTDNYYHFVYDTLPYLITYFRLKKQIPELKLLMNYQSGDRFYKFVTEFLELVGIHDVIIADDKTKYKSVYVSSSYTHGKNSTNPPREEIYDFYKELVRSASEKCDIKKWPSKIYISRRTWMHNDFSNIGTNYTTRRKMENEDELVEKLSEFGYVEIFTENMSTTEKIMLFHNAETVVGAIGGGLVNVLFCRENSKLLSIVSPTFLDVNYRFVYSFSKVRTSYIMNNTHSEIGLFKKYMRVASGNFVGEIIDVGDSDVTISYSDERISGWNSSVKYKEKTIDKSKCIPLDMGLNSPWIANIEMVVESI